MTQLNRPPRSIDAPAFHDGEIAFQRLIGVEERLDELGRRVMRDHMPLQHREFFAELPMIHLSAIDSDGHPRSFMRMGEPGFISSPDEYTMVIKSRELPGEPDDLHLDPGSKISVVGVQFETRRRNRLNATIIRSDDDEITMKVDQSYGNCPKYIQIRNTTAKPAEIDTQVHSRTTSLTDIDVDLIGKTDTFFIASRAPDLGDDPRAGIDINHRGGNPGFIEVLDASTIRFPDYKGNNFFNTFGNIALDSRVDLQLVEFVSGTLLNLKGHAEIITLQGDDFKLPDMGRRVEVKIDDVQRVEGVLQFNFDFQAYSPMLPERN